MTDPKRHYKQKKDYEALAMGTPEATFELFDFLSKNLNPGNHPLRWQVHRGGLLHLVLEGPFDTKVRIASVGSSPPRWQLDQYSTRNRDTYLGVSPMHSVVTLHNGDTLQLLSDIQSCLQRALLYQLLSERLSAPETLQLGTHPADVGIALASWASTASNTDIFDMAYWFHRHVPCAVSREAAIALTSMSG